MFLRRFRRMARFVAQRGLLFGVSLHLLRSRGDGLDRGMEASGGRERQASTEQQQTASTRRRLWRWSRGARGADGKAESHL